MEPLFPQLCLKGLPKDFRSGTPQLGNTRNKLRRQFSDEHSHEDDNGTVYLVLFHIVVQLLAFNYYDK